MNTLAIDFAPEILEECNILREIGAKVAKGDVYPIRQNLYLFVQLLELTNLVIHRYKDYIRQEFFGKIKNYFNKREGISGPEFFIQNLGGQKFYPFRYNTRNFSD